MVYKLNPKIVEKALFQRKRYPLLYYEKKQKYYEHKKLLHSRSGAFYILVIIAVFLYTGILSNIIIRIQSSNYERKILEINEMINLEKERSDRLKLKIAELNSPSRIVSKAENDFGMEISDELKIMHISEVKSDNNAEKNSYTENDSITELGKYENFLGTIYGIEDIIMIISEGVLTFFIP